MKLNYKIEGQGRPLILLHGLFGSLDNLAVLARAFSNSHQVVQVDLRNHGLSPWDDAMNYQVMANDIVKLLNDLSLTDPILVGHSMGGKVAMQLSQQIQFKQLIVLDIAPVTYSFEAHNDVFDALHAASSFKTNDKKQLHRVMTSYLPENTVRFLLKSYQNDHWIFNLSAIKQHYVDIQGWQDIPPLYQPVLFVKGGLSDYINESNITDILIQFPYAIIETIDNAGHNVHIDKAQKVIELIKRHIN